MQCGFNPQTLIREINLFVLFFLWVGKLKLEYLYIKMSIKLNKESYEKLIKENMEQVEKYFPEHSLIKNHIQLVLKESVKYHYPSDDDKQPDTENFLFSAKEMENFAAYMLIQHNSGNKLKTSEHLKEWMRNER